MSASHRVLTDVRRCARPMRFLGASGQLGYGIPTPAFAAGLARRPDLIGCDMGSIDIGPTYLGKGEMATAPAPTRRDLRKVLLGAREMNVPLVIGSAGSAGAAPHLEATLELVRDIARAEGLHFRMAVIRADMPRAPLKQAVQEGRVRGIDGMAPLSEQDIDEAAHIVGQMGMEPFRSALAEGVDVIIAGRACDTAIFAALPTMLGFPPGLSVHMAKIIECASLCCVPGGRDTILATLNHDGFDLESMNPMRRATPTSVAAHSLYEQADPYSVSEPEGRVDLREATYTALDERRTRVAGARWVTSAEQTVKLEGATYIGERAVLLAGAADPRFIACHREILPAVAGVVRELVCEDQPQDYTLQFRTYGVDGVRGFTTGAEAAPGEVFIIAECIAPTRERAAEVVRTTKQYLLHHGYPGRLSTAGNLAFPFTPPEVSLGPAYRFSVYHLMQVGNAKALFPLEIERV
jgi:Acyclic terpene utilisation family protein AtuA